MGKQRKNWTKEEVDLLRHLATSQRMSTYDLAPVLGRDAETVRSCMVKHGIPRLSRGRAMELNYFWNGGRKIDKNDYILVKCPDHPYATVGGYVREHRLVMEMVIDRYLFPHEVVHHKDGNHQNNNPDNLVLYETNGQHLKDELTGKIPAWTPEGRASILRAMQQRHEKAVREKQPKRPFARSAAASTRLRNANGSFAHQIPKGSG